MWPEGDADYLDISLEFAVDELTALSSAQLALIPLKTFLFPDDFPEPSKLLHKARRLWFARFGAVLERSPDALKDWVPPEMHHCLNIDFSPDNVANLSNAQLIAVHLCDNADTFVEAVDDARDELLARRRKAKLAQLKSAPTRNTPSLPQATSPSQGTDKGKTTPIITQATSPKSASSVKKTASFPNALRDKLKGLIGTSLVSGVSVDPSSPPQLAATSGLGIISRSQEQHDLHSAHEPILDNNVASNQINAWSTASDADESMDTAASPQETVSHTFTKENASGLAATNSSSPGKSSDTAEVSSVRQEPVTLLPKSAAESKSFQATATAHTRSQFRNSRSPSLPSVHSQRTPQLSEEEQVKAERLLAKINILKRHLQDKRDDEIEHARLNNGAAKTWNSVQRNTFASWMAEMDTLVSQYQAVTQSESGNAYRHTPSIAFAQDDVTHNTPQIASRSSVHPDTMNADQPLQPERTHHTPMMEKEKVLTSHDAYQPSNDNRTTQSHPSLQVTRATLSEAIDEARSAVPVTLSAEEQRRNLGTKTEPFIPAYMTPVISEVLLSLFPVYIGMCPPSTSWDDLLQFLSRKRSSVIVPVCFSFQLVNATTAEDKPVIAWFKTRQDAVDSVKAHEGKRFGSSQPLVVIEATVESDWKPQIREEEIVPSEKAWFVSRLKSALMNRAAKSYDGAPLSALSASFPDAHCPPSSDPLDGRPISPPDCSGLSCAVTKSPGLEKQAQTLSMLTDQSAQIQQEAQITPRGHSIPSHLNESDPKPSQPLDVTSQSAPKSTSRRGQPRTLPIVRSDWGEPSQSPPNTTTLMDRNDRNYVRPKPEPVDPGFAPHVHPSRQRMIDNGPQGSKTVAGSKSTAAATLRPASSQKPFASSEYPTSSNGIHNSRRSPRPTVTSPREEKGSLLDRMHAQYPSSGNSGKRLREDDYEEHVPLRERIARRQDEIQQPDNLRARIQ